MKTNVKLIPYNENLAEGIADMWNHSKNGWNGLSQDSTPEFIINEESCSSHVHFVLAEVDGLIAGYCKTSIDHGDTGALYVNLLNVRDDYQGKKIGKKLVLDAVQKTIELKWPRLYLNTWAGNLKAVPLYKKCGFFWEKRDDTTHLINLIPTVLQTELFADYFKKADWYDDSTRKIEIKPDQNLQNKFDCWEYSWDRDGDKLSIGFTRRGRGIRKIETNDYLVTSTVENLELVYGNSYSVEYIFKNKSGKPLGIELEGVNDGNIVFDFSEKLTVNGRQTVKAEFTVGPVDKDQPEWKTHPCVSADLKINGKHVCLKTGIVPRAPLDITIRNPEKIPVISGPENLFFDLENHLEGRAEFSITLADTECVRFPNKTVAAALNGRQKMSVPVAVHLSANSAFSQFAKIRVKPAGKKEFSFTREIMAELHTGYGSYAGKDSKAVRMGIGKYSMSVSKTQTNCIGFGDISRKNLGFWLTPPKPGRPFCNEFDQKLYTDYKITKGNGWIQMAIDYDSDRMPKLHFTKNVRLYENGIHERWYEAENRGTQPNKDLAISENHYFNKDRCVIPYCGKYILIDEDSGFDLHIWDPWKFTENWLYCETGNGSLGFSWTDEHELLFADEGLVLVSLIGNLGPGEKKATKALQITAGLCETWQSFREFIYGKPEFYPCLTRAIELEINDGNPFVKSSYKAKMISWCEMDYKGDVSFKANRILPAAARKKISKNHHLTFAAKAEQPVSVAELEVNRKDFRLNLSKAVFKISGEEIRQNEKNDVFCAGNGLISMKASKEFSPSLFSLEYEGKELLDSNYPSLGARSWWNPWPGGIMGRPNDVSIRSLLEEKRQFSFAEKEDSMGNVWKGLKLHVSIEKNKKQKGLAFSQYYLLLPGVPLVCMYSEFSKQGEYTQDGSFEYSCFFRGSGTLEDLNPRWTSDYNSKMDAGGGSVLLEIGTKNTLELHDRKRKMHIQPFTGPGDSKGQYMDMHLLMLLFNNYACAEADKLTRTRPNFLLFTEESISNEMLNDLVNVQFGHW